jgi:hypothetical protein
MNDPEVDGASTESVGVTPSSKPVPDDELDVLIAVHQELIKLADARRQHADATGATLMTTAVALGAALVATANALTDAEKIPEWAAYVALGGLVATLLLGGAARAGVLQRLSRATGPLWSQERQLVLELRTLAEEASSASERDHRRAPQDAASLDARYIKREALRLWCTTAEIRDRTVDFKNRILLWSGLSLAVALAALVAIGVSILLDSYR